MDSLFHSLSSTLVWQLCLMLSRPGQEKLDVLEAGPQKTLFITSHENFPSF